MERALARMIDGAALLSSSDSPLNLPIWACYADNFAGQCLEYDVAELRFGELGAEPLLKVADETAPPPSLGFAELSGGAAQDAVLSRLSRKRIGRALATLKDWLRAPFEELVACCEAMALRLSVEVLFNNDLSKRESGACCVRWELRSKGGRTLFRKAYFDADLRPVPAPG